MLLKEKKDNSNKKKEEKSLYILTQDDLIVSFDFKSVEDKKFMKGYLKRKKKQLKGLNIEFNLMWASGD